MNLWSATSIVPLPASICDSGESNCFSNAELYVINLKTEPGAYTP